MQNSTGLRPRDGSVGALGTCPTSAAPLSLAGAPQGPSAPALPCPQLVLSAVLQPPARVTPSEGHPQRVPRAAARLNSPGVRSIPFFANRGKRPAAPWGAFAICLQ